MVPSGASSASLCDIENFRHLLATKNPADTLGTNQNMPKSQIVVCSFVCEFVKSLPLPTIAEA